mmetsp:Transcript_53645/g.160139  ORF Transcript_53645/g.160139 Transcript_53645/m.160139 type:complete len:216 (-) Transcript_53645:1580-2227(-)
MLARLLSDASRSARSQRISARKRSTSSSYASISPRCGTPSSPPHGCLAAAEVDCCRSGADLRLRASSKSSWSCSTRARECSSLTLVLSQAAASERASARAASHAALSLRVASPRAPGSVAACARAACASDARRVSESLALAHSSCIARVRCRRSPLSCDHRRRSRPQASRSSQHASSSALSCSSLPELRQLPSAVRSCVSSRCMIANAWLSCCAR